MNYLITCFFAILLASVISAQLEEGFVEIENDPQLQTVPKSDEPVFNFEKELESSDTLILVSNETIREIANGIDGNATVTHNVKASVPFCEAYVAENDTVGIEIINLTAAMNLIASHRHSPQPIPVTALPEMENNTSDQPDSIESDAGDNSSFANSSTPAFSSTSPSPTAPPRGRCIAIYLFARWCSFSAAAAPYISALAKQFSACCMKFVAVDAANDVSGTTTFFGAGSVPQLIIYRPHRPVVRISPITTDLALLVELVNNATGFNVTIANISTLPDEEDYNDNVLPVAPVREFDMYLIAAWIHTLLTLLVIAYKFEYVRHLILSIWNYLRGFGHEIHAHME